MTWRVEVSLMTGVQDYADELSRVLERNGYDYKPEVYRASQIVLLLAVPKNVARTVTEWTMDFWAAAHRIEVRKNLLVVEELPPPTMNRRGRRMLQNPEEKP